MKDFINRLFEAKEQAQVYHFQVEKYGKHEAFGNFYEKMNEHIDTLVETYQGQYDIIEGYDIIEKNDIDKSDSVKYFKELGEYIIENRHEYIEDKDTHLLSIVDDILTLTYQTLYKLRFLD